MKIEASRNSGSEEDLSGTAIATELSAGIVDVFSGEMVNAADFGCAVALAATTQPDPPERAMRRRWWTVAAAALVTAAYAGWVVVLAAETSPAPIAGIAPSYGPKTISSVPNAAAIVRPIWVGTRCRLRPAGARG